MSKQQPADAPAHALDPIKHPGCYIYRCGKKRTVVQILMELKEFFPDSMSWPALESSEETYITYNTSFETVCAYHGSFNRSPNAIFDLRNGGCPQCAKERGLSIYRRINQDEDRQFVMPSNNMRVTNLTNKGFVYIISNRVFNDANIRKIGLTQGHDPMDRINTLSGSSVPYQFDIDAIVYSDDVLRLEQKLHAIFDSRRLSSNREFFNVVLGDVEEAVKKLDPTATYLINTESNQFKMLVRDHSKHLTEAAKNRGLVK